MSSYSIKSIIMYQLSYFSYSIKLTIATLGWLISSGIADPNPEPLVVHLRDLRVWAGHGNTRTQMPLKTPHGWRGLVHQSRKNTTF